MAPARREWRRICPAPAPAARPDLAGAPVYCFKWAGGDPPPARWVTIEDLSDAELAKVVDGICEAAVSAGLDPKQAGPSELSDLSDRELVARALEAFGTPQT